MRSKAQDTTAKITSLELGFFAGFDKSCRVSNDKFIQ